MQFHSNSHCLASPSSSSRWLRCTGSLELIRKYPPPFTSNPALEWGSKVHNFANNFLNSHDVESLYQQLINSASVNELAIQEAYEYYEYIQSIKQETSTCIFETKLNLTDIFENMYGTPDAIIINGNHLHVIDLKTGREWVSANNNSQLMLYAHGAIQFTNVKIEAITLHIYQNNERSGRNINTHTFSINHLNNFIENVKSTLQLFSQGLYKYKITEHCKYCPVQNKCVVFSSQMVEGIYSIKNKQSNVDNLSTEEMAEMFRIYKDLTPFIESIQAKLLDTESEKLDKLHLEIKVRKIPQKYSSTEHALSYLVDKEGASIEEVAPRVLISPAKLKKLNEQYYEKLTKEDIIEPAEETKYLSIKKGK